MNVCALLERTFSLKCRPSLRCRSTRHRSIEDTYSCLFPRPLRVSLRARPSIATISPKHGRQTRTVVDNCPRVIRPHNGNSSIHQIPTLSIFLALFYPYACNGPPSGLETVLSETCWLSFSTTFFDISIEWTRNRVCLPLRIPVFLKIKNKKQSRSGRKIGAVGDDKQLIFFTRPYIAFFTDRYIDGNQLTSLPGGLFSGLTNLRFM